MPREDIGIWLIGAWGGVSTTVAVGLAALRHGLTNEVGLVTGRPPFDGLDLAAWDRFTVGGHEIRETDFATEARKLHDDSRVFSHSLLEGVAESLAEFDRNVRPGTLVNVGSTIEGLAGPKAEATRGEKPSVAVERIVADLDAFRSDNDLSHVVVVNLASTEPPQAVDVPESWAELSTLIADSNASPVPASSLYAVAAMQAGCDYVNFTPSVGSDLPAIDEYARQQGVVHCGRDGKTGETLLKSVLAPMFAARNLEVMSWVGHNIFGNMDGQVLDDPVNKATKVRSKSHLLDDILGYSTQSHVSIEYIKSLGDWKTAWDHVHFRGFLDTPMVMSFTWQGCDSILAAPLVLDLVRLTELAHRRGETGTLDALASFFKSPMGSEEPKFAEQFAKLLEWASR